MGTDHCTDVSDQIKFGIVPFLEEFSKLFNIVQTIALNAFVPIEKKEPM